MRHAILRETSIGKSRFSIQIELIPENDSEIVLIDKYDSLTDKENNREVITNYLSFCLGELYSPITFNWKKGNVFEITYFKS